MTADREPVDPALDAMLRENARETPPAHVDAAILAAAHRAVASAPRARSRRHWRLWVPFAAAATVAAVVIGLHPVERQAPEATRASDVPPGAASRQSAAASDRSNTPMRDAKPQAQAGAPASAHEAQRATASARHADEASAANEQVSQDMRIAQTIERIRALRRDGRDAEAVTALAQLREIFGDVDAHLPPDLRAWANTVRR
jgi:hypothetical protein